MKVAQLSLATQSMLVNKRKAGSTLRLQGAEGTKLQNSKYLGSTVQENGDKRVATKVRGNIFKRVVRAA